MSVFIGIVGKLQMTAMTVIPTRRLSYNKFNDVPEKEKYVNIILMTSILLCVVHIPLKIYF